ncbi:hypothetical protein H5T87_05220 [bacterium]|nr:hypothetical protein [bacterium]
MVKKFIIFFYLFLPVFCFSQFLLTIPYSEEPPTIDGKVSPEEWKKASAIGILFPIGQDELSLPSTIFYLCYDSQCLYIGFTCQSFGQPIAQERERDGNVWEDDAVEIFLSPSFPRYFQFILNSKNSIWDSDGKDASWNCEWKHAISLKENGWEGEIAIPFSSLGVTPKEGDLWRFNLARDVPSPRKLSLSFAPCKSSFHEPENFAILSFGNPTDAFRLYPLPLQNLYLDPTKEECGKLSLVVESPNSSLISGKLRKGEEVKDFGDRLSPNERKEIISFYLSPKERASISLSAKNLEGKELITLQMAMERPPLLNVSLVRRFLIKGCVDVSVSSDVLSEKMKRIELSLLKNGNEVLRKECKVEGGKGEDEIRVAHLPEGDYELLIKVYDGEGNLLASQKESLTIPQRPAWLGSKAGITDEVLPPWTPIKVNGDNIEVWNRSYTFGEDGLPKSIVSKGKELLSAPIKWELEVEGMTMDLKGRKTVLQEKPNIFVQTRSGKNYICKTSVEYDGMVRFDVSLNSSNGKPFILKKLRLIIPIKTPYAKYLHYYPGMWGTSSNSFGIKEDWESPFRPLIFIADEEKGLTWFTESDQNFHLAQPEKAIQVRRKKDTTFLIINIIDLPVSTSSYSFTFGIQATPVRPVPVAWWLKERICHWGYYGMEKAPASGAISITYPTEGNINQRQGSLQAWVRIDFDTQEEVKEGVSRGDYNRNFLAIYLPNGDIASLYWNIDDRGMRFYAYDATNKTYPIILGAPAKLDKGWHHIALSWGKEIRIFVDGVETARKEFYGLFGKDVELREGRIVLGGGRCEMAIAQFAIYDTPIESVIPSPVLPKQNALLWESYENVSLEDGRTNAEIGKGGILSGKAVLEESPYGKALCLWSKNLQGMLMLDVAKEMGARTIVFHEHWTDIQNYTETTHKEELRSLVEALHKRGMRLAVYFGYEMADIAPEFPFYSQECLRWRPGQWFYTRQPEQKDYGVCYNSPWADFLADGMEKVLKKYDIDGVYLDGTAVPMGCDNTLHGCGYYDEKGNLHATFPIFAVRDLMKRIYTICYHHRPNEPFVNAHNSTYLGSPTLAFTTSYWDGEQFAGAQRDNKHPLEILPLDSFRCEFMGHNIGVPADFLVYEGNPFTYQEGMAIALIHDVFPRPPGLGSEGFEMASKIWKAFEEFGAMESQWIPYWQEDRPVKTNSEDVYASTYLKKGEGAIIVISNLGKEAKQVSLQIDSKKLGFKPKEAKEIITSTNLPVENGKISLFLPTFRVRVLVLKK